MPHQCWCWGFDRLAYTTAGTPVGVSDSLLHLSIGLEDCAELIADLEQALAG